MGNYIQKAELDLSSFAVVELLKEEAGLEITRLQNVHNPLDIILTKNITEVVSQMPANLQLEVLKRIEQQPLWWTLLKFDEFEQNHQQVNMIMTPISPINLEAEVVSLRSTGAIPSVTNSWFIMTNLLLAVVDLEHKLDFNEHISMKNIYLNQDKSLTILNPYFRDSHLKKALQDIIKPASVCPSWKPEYSQSYFARREDLEKNRDMRAIHFVHQNYVADMLQSVALAMLGLITLRSDTDLVLEPYKKSAKTELNVNLIQQLIKHLDDTQFDPDFVDLIEFILNHQPKSAVELGFQLQERQHFKMMESIRECNFTCSDPEAARRLLPRLRGQSSYDPRAYYQESTDAGRDFANSKLRPPINLPPPLPIVLGPPGAPPQANPIRTVVHAPQEAYARAVIQPAIQTSATGNPDNKQSLNTNDSQPRVLGIAKELDVLKGWMEGGNMPKQQEPVATEIRKLKDFSAGPDGRPNLNGVENKDRPAKSIEFLKDYMVTNSQSGTVPSKIIFDALKGFTESKTADTKPAPIAAPHVPLPDTSKLEFNTTPLQRTNLCRCHMGSHVCRCRQVGNTGYQCTNNHMNFPLYSPYAHLYYMGKPALSHTSHILHDYPQSST